MTKEKISDPWAEARKEWDAAAESEKEAYYRRYAALIDRWQAETDAMAKEDDTEENIKE